MNIFVAGASGAIGRPLITGLIRHGHRVTGMTRSDKGARALAELGASVARVSAFDEPALEQALQDSNAQVVIDELTSLPVHQSDMASAAAGDRQLRLEGGGNLIRAAQKAGVRRYIQQSSGFFVQPGAGLADETEALAVNATPSVAAAARTYTELEHRLLKLDGMEAVILRYGFFYGPGTWYSSDGSAGLQARQREIPLIGEGEGVWSWVHIDDAASATVASVTIPVGIYNIVGDDPLPHRQWLPAFAKAMGGLEPIRLSVDEALNLAGEDAVYYCTRLRGTSNKKAKSTFGFAPRRLEWLDE